MSEETVVENFESLSAVEVGHLLEGFGLNLLVRQTERTARFLESMFDFAVLRLSCDYAVLQHRKILYQLHADSTYHAHPLPGILPENGVRGAGVELRLYQVDPDVAERKARQAGHVILQETRDKPHGLRECYLLDPDGYCWVPSIKIEG